MELKALLDSLDFGVAVIAPDWRVTVWSAGAARLTGLPSDRVLDQSFWVLFPNARGSYVEEALQDVRSEEHTSELQSRRDLVCRLLLEKKKQLPSALPPVLYALARLLRTD